MSLPATGDYHHRNIIGEHEYFLIAVYLFIYLYVCVCVFVCYSHNSKSIKPNRMEFGGMIGYYPGAIWFDFGIDRVRGQGQGHEKVPKKWLRRRYALYRVPVLV